MYVCMYVFMIVVDVCMIAANMTSCVPVPLENPCMPGFSFRRLLAYTPQTDACGD
jgi:hypothetical protein